MGHLHSCLSLQGDWILSGRDECDNFKNFRLYMYVVKCVNVGSTKDPFLTQVSEFAVLFGNELDAEVKLRTSHKNLLSSYNITIF